MDHDVSIGLIDALQRHGQTVTLDKELFLRVLEGKNDLLTSRFDEVLSEERQLVEEEGRYHYLSLRRLFRNRNARNYELSIPGMMWDWGLSKAGIYSSDSLTRSLRRNHKIIETMAFSDHPFSLLAKFETYSYGNPNDVLVHQTRPILVIPDASSFQMTVIHGWEERNTIYTRERGILLGEKTVSRDEYLRYA